MQSEIISGIIGAFAGGLTSYLATKGNNKATIEDTGLITKIQEAIKAELSFSNQHTLNIAALEREAIFDYHKRIGVYYNFLITSIDLNTSMEDFTEFNKNIKKIKQEFNDFKYSLQHLLLFIDEVDFFEAQTDLVIVLTENTYRTLNCLKELNNLYTLNYHNYVFTLIDDESYQKNIGYKKVMDKDESKLKNELKSYIARNKPRYVAKRDVIRKLLIERIKKPTV